MIEPARPRRRAAALTILVGALSAGLVTATAQTASAFSSAQSLAGPNAWIMADLAAQGYGTLVESKTSPGTLDETFDTRTVTGGAKHTPTRVGRAAGWLRKVPGLGGRAGAILDVGSVILDLGGFDFGGDLWEATPDAPPAPRAPSVGSGPVPYRLGSASGVVGAAPGAVRGADTPSLDINRRDDTASTEFYGSETPSVGRCASGGAAGMWIKLTGYQSARTAGAGPYSPGGGSVPFTSPTYNVWPQTGGGQLIEANICGSFDQHALGDVPGSAGFGTPVNGSEVRFYSDRQSVAGGPAADAPPALSVLTSRVECRDATGETTVVEQTSRAVVGPGAQVGPPDVRCPDGKVAVSGGVTATAPDGTVTELVPRIEAPAWVGTIPKQAPGCTLAGAVCTLDVQSRPDTGSETWTSCTSAPSRCVDWEAQPQPDQFRCLYGGYVVDQARCGGINYVPGREGGPAVVEAPYPRPVGAPAITPAPQTQPGPEVMPKPGDEGSDVSEKCPPSPSVASVLTGWWVYKATTCALSWAFVPTKPLGSIMGPIVPSLTAAPPFSWFGQFRDVFVAPAAPSTACPGWTVKVDDYTSPDLTCDSDFNRMIQLSRPIFLGLMLVSAFWPLCRSLWYAVLPFVRPVPTS